MAKIVIKDSKTLVSSNFKVASSFIDRLVGLMFKREMRGYDALLIKSCNSIHTFFMLFAIDVVFLNKHYEVIKVIRAMRPWRMTRMYFRACQVLEMSAGSLTPSIKEGDRLEVVCTN